MVQNTDQGCLLLSIYSNSPVTTTSLAADPFLHSVQIGGYGSSGHIWREYRLSNSPWSLKYSREGLELLLKM